MRDLQRIPRGDGRDLVVAYDRHRHRAIGIGVANPDGDTELDDIYLALSPNELGRVYDAVCRETGMTGEREALTILMGLFREWPTEPEKVGVLVAWCHTFIRYTLAGDAPMTAALLGELARIQAHLTPPEQEALRPKVVPWMHELMEGDKVIALRHLTITVGTRSHLVQKGCIGVVRERTKGTIGSDVVCVGPLVEWGHGALNNAYAGDIDLYDPPTKERL